MPLEERAELTLEERAERKKRKKRRVAALDSLPIALRYDETAELLSVSVRQVHNLANAGRLRRAYLGPRCVRIVTSSAIELIGE
jgi:archaellum biogenesis ATPase FlaH